MIAGPIWTIGCMSGTSADGVDAAALLTDGISLEEFGQREFRPYTARERETIRAAFGDWPGTAAARAASQVVTRAHREILGNFSFGAVVGFHGQTLAHDPAGGRTHQAGSPAAIAESLRRTVVGDFRAADMEAGGQGAPLAPFYHFALAKRFKLPAPVLFLNLGGVGNLSYADPRKDSPEEAGALIAFDTGPANGPIDDLLSERLGLTHDIDGDLAAKGNVSGLVMQRFLEHPYFCQSPPKSMDRNHFQELRRMTGALDTADAAATLTACAAEAAAAGLRFLPEAPSLAIICGGGRKNRTLMRLLIDALPVRVADVDSLGLDGDMLEAEAFGYLAVRALRNLPLSSPTTTGCRRPVSGGQVFGGR